jgi:hypothetical protein
MSRKPKDPDAEAARRRAAERAFRRKHLEEVELHAWRPLRFHHETDGTWEIQVGDTVPSFIYNEDVLRRELSAEHFLIYRTLFELLMTQALAAAYAVPVAKVELEIAAGRREGGKTTKELRQDEAKKREAKLQSVGDQILADDADLSNSELAGRLSERGLGGSKAIRRKLRPRPKK